MDQNGVIEIVGVISAVLSDAMTYKVRTQDKNVYVVKHEEKFLPIRQGDLFRGFLTQIEGTNNYKPVSKPLFTIGVDDDTVKGYLMSFLGKVIPVKSILALYKNLQDNVQTLCRPEISTVSAYLSYLSEQWSSSGSQIALEMLQPLTPQQAIAFINKWRASNDMRLLYLLGLTKKEIYSCDIAITTLYKNLCDNPYTVGAVPIEKAETIDLMTGRKPLPTDVKCGKILRALHADCVGKGYACTTERSLFTKFPDLLSHKDRLVNEFGLVWDEIKSKTMVYIKLNYEAEVYVANKLAELQQMPPINPNILINLDNVALDPEQKVGVRMALSNNVSILTAHAGCGKCLGVGTPILMHNGTIKAVEDVVVGDLLMGDNSKPRKVLSTTSGEDDMFKIHQEAESLSPPPNPYTVNSVHVLTLRYSPATSFDQNNSDLSNAKNSKHEIIDIPLNEYLAKSSTWKETWKGYQVAVDFPKNARTFEEYLSNEKIDSIPYEFKTASRDVRQKIYQYHLGRQLFPGTLREDLIYIYRSLNESDVSLKIIPVGRGKYYGFTLDGNGRFLLGDFTVTHNTYSIEYVQKSLDVSHVCWCATSFTGKAVSRIKQVTKNDNAATMHRMIARPQEYRDFTHLIIDEASMVTVLLMYRFFRTFRHPYAITFVGDITQLPPIGWGSLMRECMLSRTIPLTWLKTNHRVRTKDGHLDCIIANSTRIARWRDNVPYNFITGPNFVTENSDITYLIELIGQFKTLGIEQDQFMIISPYNDGLDLINMAVQVIYHGQEKFVIGSNGGSWKIGDPLTRPDIGMNKDEKCWYVGDKIMMIQNNYEIDVMNGEEGVILDLDTDKLVAKFDEKIVGIPLAKNSRLKKRHSEHFIDDDADNNFDTRDIVLSYAITVHKSQGSQWSIVVGYIKPGGDSYKSFLNKNLFYTLQTRTIDRFILLGSVVTASRAIANPLPYRCECLQSRLNLLLPCLFDEIVDDALTEELAAKATAPKIQYKDYEIIDDDEDDDDDGDW